ncbi:MAG: radical SAM protein [Gaiellales bacterium]|nr:MAG: radical SAM protein [Gaiellales bacterium]
MKRGRRTEGADLKWVDAFIDRIRPYVTVREQDAVLIKMPNQAFRLNRTGVQVMSFLLGGGGVDDLLRQAGADKAGEVALFLDAVKRGLEGSLLETDPSPAVDVKPLELNFSSLPVLAEIALTDRCNLRCVFCYAGCPSIPAASGKGRELSQTEVRRLIDRVRGEAQVPSLSFTGGEPTLRHDLPDLVAYAARIKGMRVNLITNGTLVTPGLAGALRRAGLASAQVSIEGATAATHDAATGVAGSHERSIAGLENLAAAGVRVHANTTINRLNLHECVSMPGLAVALGLDRFSMNLVIPAGAAAANHSQLVRYEELGPVLEGVMAASRRHGVEFMWYSPTPLCLFNPIARGLGNKGCSACDGLLSVDSSGGVRPCSSWDETVGSLLTGGFEEVWGSARARAYRAKSLAHPGCRECDSFSACNGACPLYWGHFGFSELERHGVAAARRKAGGPGHQEAVPAGREQVRSR